MKFGNTHTSSSSPSAVIAAGLEGHTPSFTQSQPSFTQQHQVLAQSSTFYKSTKNQDSLYLNGQVHSFRLDDVDMETTVIMETPEYTSNQTNTNTNSKAKTKSRATRFPRLTLKKPFSADKLSPGHMQDMISRTSQSFTYGQGRHSYGGGVSQVFNSEQINYLNSHHGRPSMDPNRGAWRRSSFNLGQYPHGRLSTASRLSQPVSASPRVSMDSRNSNSLHQLPVTFEGGASQEATEDYVNSQSNSSKAPRKISTRDQYLEEDTVDFGDLDPAVQLKKQLQSMLVSNPEIEKQIKDVINAGDDVDLATTTKSLDLQVDKSGAFCINQYIMIKTLGQGSIGKVKLCYNTLDKKLYAVKMIDRKRLNQQFRVGRMLRKSKDKRNRSNDRPAAGLIREIAVLKKLEHHNVVKLHEVIDPMDESQPLMLVMEYLQEGPVVKQVQTTPSIQFDRLNEEDAAEYFRMMCNGLDYLHYNRIVHGDLKPENLLLDAKGELKIADFGCARMMAVDNNLDKNNRYGTPSFRAPEMQTGRSYDPFNADIWAMGVCLYVMVFGCLPFPGSTEAEVYQAIQTQEVSFPDDIEVSVELRNLLQLILQKDPLKRITLYDLMSHEWVTEWGRIQLIPLMQMTRPPVRIEVSAVEEDQAIVEDDKMVNMDFEEKVFQDGEFLIRQGDTSSVLYFILSGAVEVKDPQWMHRLSEDVRFSLTLERSDDEILFDSPIVEEEEGEGNIYLDTKRTAEVFSRVKQNALKKQGKDLLLEVKGPANIIGDISICYPVRPYPYNVQARGQVHALELTSDKLQSALMSIYDQYGKRVLSVFTGNSQQTPQQQQQQQQQAQQSSKSGGTPFVTPFSTPRQRRTSNHRNGSFTSVKSVREQRDSSFTSVSSRNS